MLRNILVYGLIAGVVEGVLLFGTTVALQGNGHHPPLWVGMIVGYLSMLIALSAIFVGIKRYRDADLGGVIGFWPALAMGLCISMIAGVFYVLAWEAAMWATHMDFAGSYAKLMIDQAKAKGVSGAALAKVIAEMDQFKQQYANPLYRLGEGFTEIFPVGVLVSLISAGLLRNRRFLPARRG
jgi:uncharacterized membrane protein YhaH (DUF805 family)